MREDVADRYAADLSRVDSNAIAIPLAQYYAGVGDYTKALGCARPRREIHACKR